MISTAASKPGAFARPQSSARRPAASRGGLSVSALPRPATRNARSTVAKDGARQARAMMPLQASPVTRPFSSRVERRISPLLDVTSKAAPTDGASTESFLESPAGKYAHLFASLGLFLWADKMLKAACATASISFPSPLIGMFGIFATLSLIQVVSPEANDKVFAFFQPALDWLARWLPLFYVPSLVVLPLAINGIPGADLTKIFGILVGGMVASLVVTAQAAVVIRQLVQTTMGETEIAKAAPPFQKWHYVGWAGVGAASLLATAVAPGMGFAMSTAELARPAMLAGTVGGLLAGSAMPKDVRAVLHPIIVCAAVGNATAALVAAVSGMSYFGALKMFLNKGAAGYIPGGGDLLMGFLGSVILSFGFRIFTQRKLMVRHAAEIFGCTTISAAFSLFSTAFIAKAVGLAPELARAIVPRSVTVALAMPIATLLEAQNTSITAAAVVLTGLLGANFAQTLLNKLGYKDPITRGLATAGSAHGLGTAALAATEPEALPFCALAYALIGIISSVLVAIPPVRLALLAICG